jgi:phosphate transport system ATP-binding protein
MARPTRDRGGTSASASARTTDSEVPAVSSPLVDPPCTTPSAPRDSIVARNVNLWYGDFQALRDVSINIRQGMITGLIGPSGCGKTTLLRSFNRINERYGNVTTAGEITILGKNIYDANVSLGELRKTVGMVFQRPNPLPISVYENVAFGLRVHSGRGTLSATDRDQMVETALREVQLWDSVKDNLKKRATGLTLEQQQKLCIARLLPLKPRVILMDEPCSALDAEGTEKVEELIGSLREKYTIVIVTHNMAQARRATDECIYMLLGEIIEHARTSDLFLRPQRKETEMYIEGRYG